MHLASVHFFSLLFFIQEPLPLQVFQFIQSLSPIHLDKQDSLNGCQSQLQNDYFKKEICYTNSEHTQQPKKRSNKSKRRTARIHVLMCFSFPISVIIQGKLNITFLIWMLLPSTHFSKPSSSFIFQTHTCTNHTCPLHLRAKPMLSKLYSYTSYMRGWSGLAMPACSAYRLVLFSFSVNEQMMA